MPEMIAIDTQHFGQPGVIMERIAGQTLMAGIVGASENESAQHIVAFCKLFARLHEVDWRPLAEQPEQFADRTTANHLLIERYRQMINATGMTCALPVLDWVTAQTEALICQQPSIVHQDFHPDNLLWTGQELKVIDWTAIGVYDRRIDLAWTLLLVSVYESTALRDLVLKQYQAASTIKIEYIEVFEALACVRRFNDLWQTLKQGGASWGLRPETAAAMRAQAPQYQATYARLREVSGLRIMEIEELIANLSTSD